MSLHIIAWAFHITALHSMSFRGPELLISKFQSRLEFQLFSKSISKPWVFKIINSSHFTPRTLNFKIFPQENDLDSFQYGFQPLHLRFCPFVSYFSYHPFTKSPYRGPTPFKKFLFCQLVQILWKFKKRLLSCLYFNKEAMWDPHWGGVT